MYRPTSKVSVAKQLGRDVTCQWLTDQEDATWRKERLLGLRSGLRSNRAVQSFWPGQRLATPLIFTMEQYMLNSNFC
ncbi:hypothetical protein RRG08_049925 [Elysia crispata]|uniref:Uncharacterized protein n=1 Tax=Elysia crispata TaxID=231223 RepID=A0AAE1CQ23_9GAST|nr:hypothetical protein RRG08_049925 [Elysia crispata]